MTVTDAVCLQVRVLRPMEGGQHLEVAILGRGQFVGERTLITGKLRSADCVALGQVSVVVINKSDFWDLDNPLLAWMLDYDAVTCVLKVKNSQKEDRGSFSRPNAVSLFLTIFGNGNELPGPQFPQMVNGPLEQKYWAAPLSVSKPKILSL